MPDVVLNKKFDVRNGNTAAIATDTFPSATIIAYQNAAAKTEIIDALCDTGNYEALDPATRPSRQAFANQEIKNWLRDKVKQNRQRIAESQKPVVDESDLP